MVLVSPPLAHSFFKDLSVMLRDLHFSRDLIVWSYLRYEFFRQNISRRNSGTDCSFGNGILQFIVKNDSVWFDLCLLNRPLRAKKVLVRISTYWSNLRKLLPINFVDLIDWKRRPIGNISINLGGFCLDFCVGHYLRWWLIGAYNCFFCLEGKVTRLRIILIHICLADDKLGFVLVMFHCLRYFNFWIYLLVLLIWVVRRAWNSHRWYFFQIIVDAIVWASPWV